ncbi:hypothetical protein [Nonomuraea sp. NPDC048901]|uniref:hypothetical protein n=1 Tax=Nonomuraea sp. NPDC048901 TaxID=3155627 RepID=UPI0033D02BBD
MRLVTRIGVAATLLVSQGTPPEPTATPAPTPTPTPTSTANTNKKSSKTAIPPELKNVPSLRVLPWDPRQASHVRIFVHCPPKANHALIGSTAFALKGSRRLYREVGLGLSDRGLAHRAVSISYSALPGFHGAHLKCVKVKMNQKTRIRRIRVLGRDATPLYVRRFSIWQFFD